MNIYEVYYAASSFRHYLNDVMNINLFHLINKEIKASEDI